MCIRDRRYTQESCKLLYKSEIAPGIYNYTLSAPAIAGAASRCV